MNWPHIKTTLILLFLSINLFLIIWNVVQTKEGATVAPETIKDAVQILANNGIKVDKKLIPSTVPKMNSITVMNITSDEGSFLGKILGDNYLKSGNRFYNEKRSVEIDGNTFKITESLDLSDADAAKAWLEGMKIDMSLGKIEETDNGYVFKEETNGYTIFGSEIKVTTDKGMWAASGVWGILKNNKSSELEIKHITSVLPLLAAEKSCPPSCTIASINLGYMLPFMVNGGNERFTEALLTPVYEITLSNGEKYYYSALK